MQSLLRQSLGASLAVTAVAAIAASLALAAGPAAAKDKTYKFSMVRTPALNAFPACVANAKGSVKIVSNGVTETMTVSVDNLPPNTDFDMFVIQQPNAPFGMAWYQSDLETDQYGHGSVKVIGRFSDETFIVAPGSVAAPHEHDSDAATNPATAPVHMYHVGLWFNSATDAANNGCPSTVTPFNGEHDAGVQLLNTSTFPDLQGPLLNVKS
jgi:hypothetical protein